MDRDMKETKSDKVDKFRELQQRDKEMTQFIDTFEETKQQQMEANTANELTIIALLERILPHTHKKKNKQNKTKQNKKKKKTLNRYKQGTSSTNKHAHCGCTAPNERGLEV
jgi:hypothetical protein